MERGEAMVGVRRRWRIGAVGPGHAVLLAIGAASLIVLGLAPTLLVRALGQENGLWFLLAWWTGPNGGDSWLPIGNALAELARVGPEGFYQAAYHETHFQFIYPPTSLVFFQLTSWPPWIEWGSMAAMNRLSWWLTLATALATAIVMGLAPVRLGLVARRPGPLEWAGYLALGAIGTLLFFPFNSGFHNGNIQTWLNLLVILGLLAWLCDARLAAGVLFGLVCIIKPQLSLLALWGLLRRDGALVAGMAVVVGAFGLASLWRFGLKIQFDYVELMGFLSRRGESYFGNHSVNGLLNRMLFIGNNTWFDPWHREIHYDARVHAGTMAAAAVLVLPALWPSRHLRGASGTSARLAGMLDLCLALIAFTLAAPVAYTNHFGFMLPVFWVALLAVLRIGWRPPVALGLLAFAYVLAANFWIVTNLLAPTRWNFLQSTMLFAAVALIGLLYRLRRAALQVR